MWRILPAHHGERCPHCAPSVRPGSVRKRQDYAHRPVPKAHIWEMYRWLSDRSPVCVREKAQLRADSPTNYHTFEDLSEESSLHPRVSPKQSLTLHHTATRRCGGLASMLGVSEVHPGAGSPVMGERLYIPRTRPGGMVGRSSSRPAPLPVSLLDLDLPALLSALSDRFVLKV